MANPAALKLQLAAEMDNLDEDQKSMTSAVLSALSDIEHIVFLEDQAGTKFYLYILMYFWT